MANDLEIIPTSRPKAQDISFGGLRDELVELVDDEVGGAFTDIGKGSVQIHEDFGPFNSGTIFSFSDDTVGIHNELQGLSAALRRDGLSLGLGVQADMNTAALKKRNNRVFSFNNDGQIESSRLTVPNLDYGTGPGLVERIERVEVGVNDSGRKDALISARDSSTYVCSTGSLNYIGTTAPKPSNILDYRVVFLDDEIKKVSYDGPERVLEDLPNDIPLNPIHVMDVARMLLGGAFHADLLVDGLFDHSRPYCRSTRDRLALFSYEPNGSISGYQPSPNVEVIAPEPVTPAIGAVIPPSVPTFLSEPHPVNRRMIELISRGV